MSPFVPEILLALSAPLLFLHARRERGAHSALAFFAGGAALGLFREPLFTLLTGLYSYAPGTANFFGVPLYLAFGYTAPFYVGACLARDLLPERAGAAARFLSGGALAALVALPIEVVAIQPETRWWTWHFTPAHALFSSPALVLLGWFLSATLFLAAAAAVDARVRPSRRALALVALVPILVAVQSALLLLSRAAIPLFR